MKKGWKIFWIVCGSLLGLGVILLVAGIGMGASLSLMNLHTPGWVSIDMNEAETAVETNEVNEVLSYTGIREIEVDAEALELHVGVSQDDSVRVSIENSVQVECYQDAEKLVIESDYKWLTEQAGTVWLYLPVTQLSEADIQVDAGAIYIEEICAMNLEISVDAGEVVVESFEAQTVEFECGAGRVEAYGKAGQRLAAECGAGEIALKLEGTKEDYDYDLECSVGEILIDGASYRGIANHHNRSYGTGKWMELECGIGSITVDFH